MEDVLVSRSSIYKSLNMEKVGIKKTGFTEFYINKKMNVGENDEENSRW